MSQFLPKFKAGSAITLTASATITGGQLVEVTGVRTVGPAGATSLAWIGTAAHDAASGGSVIVHLAGPVHLLTAAADVTAGNLLVAAAAGTVTPLAAVTTPTAADVTGTRALVGVALTSVDVSEVSDDRIEVILFR